MSRRSRRTVVALIAVCCLCQPLNHSIKAQVTLATAADLATIGGNQPLGGLVRGADGALYGTTAGGGAENCGIVYRLTTDGTLSLVHSFTRSHGCYPVGDLSLGPDGSLYGVTYYGGDTHITFFPGLGTVFKVLPNGTGLGTFTLLRSFPGAPGGTNPYATLTLAPNGLLYGSTTGGSGIGGGLIFTIDPQLPEPDNFAIVANGLNSQAQLTLGSDGFLYGTTWMGQFSAGTVFRMALNGDLETLYSFPFIPNANPQVCPEGAQPLGELIEAADGYFYGTTSTCGPGPNGAGTVFRISPTGDLTTLHAFSEGASPGTYPGGAAPWGGMTLGADGNLFGATTAGGDFSNGILYRVTPGEKTPSFEILRSFSGTDGQGPQEGRLLEVSPGVFYGTSGAGPGGSGQVFKLSVDVNSAPVAQNGTIATFEDAAVNGMLTASDIDDDPLTFTIVTNGTLGSAVVTDAATGAFTYTPNANVSGTDTFTFKGNDGTVDSNVATVTVTITPINDAPVANDASMTTTENTPISGTLSANDAEGQALTFSILSNGTRGTPVITDSATGAFTYTPNANVSGADSFTFQASDGFVTSNVATVSVSITAVNLAPVAQTGVVTTTEETSVNGTLGATDPEGAAITFSVASQPAQGAVTLTDTLAGAFTYTPSAGAIGYDTFTFNVEDASGASSVGSQMVFIVASTPRWPGQAVRASVGVAGGQGNAASVESTISADGRYIVFSSDASTLVQSDTNGFTDIFVHDRQSATTTRVSVATGGGQANGGSTVPAVSADGRYVAFDSQALNLASGGTFGGTRIFVHDRQTGETTLVSVAPDGATGNADSRRAALSADGRYVAFDSDASNLVANDTNATRDVFVSDRAVGTTTRLSVASDGSQGNGGSFSPAVSADGRYVAFYSSASNLVAGDTNESIDVFVHDQLTGATTRVSVSSSGAQGNGASTEPHVSVDGRYVVFQSWASNFAAGDANGWTDVFLHDRLTGQTTLISATPTGGNGNASSVDPTISADGRYVAYRSFASNLVPGDTNGGLDAFVWDRLTGQTRRVSVSGDGLQSNGASEFPAITADGQFIAFSSAASNLAPSDTNAVNDVFVVGGVRVSPDSQSVQAQGGNLAVVVSFRYPGTTWSAVSAVSWITITNQDNPTGNGTVMYTVAPNPTGMPRTGTLTVAAQTVTIAQDAATAPVAENGALSTNEDTPVNGTLAATDPNGDALTFTIVANGAVGTAVVTNTATGAFTYTPNANANGTDTFTFQVSDGASTSSIATVTATIAPVNDAPVADNRSLTTPEDTPGLGTLGATDVDGPALTFSIVANGSRGTATITNASTGEFRYTPNPNANGTDRFTFQATDGLLTSNVGALDVNITPVNDAPTPQTGVVSTTEGVAVTGTFMAADLEGGAITFSVATQPARGVVTLVDASAGTFTYLPNPNATGYDTFTFTVQDADGAATTTTQMVFIVASSARWPGQTVRVSVSASGAEGTDHSEASSLSADGRYVALASSANNFVADDTNPGLDIFIRDRVVGSLERVTATSFGDNRQPALSADGRYVVFATFPDVFLKDRQTGALVAVREDPSIAPNGDNSFPSVSADGRFVVFRSTASNLIVADTNGAADIFRHDRVAGRTARVSVSSSGSEANGGSASPVQSADGRFIAFRSSASNLTVDDSNGAADVFLRDAQGGQTTRVSIATSGAQANGGSDMPSISADGRFVAFASTATDLVAGDTNNAWDIFVHDRTTGSTTRVSIGVLDAEANGNSLAPAISADGRYVSFFSVASNLVANDGNGFGDIFVHDRLTGLTIRVDVSSDGAETNVDNTIAVPSPISADGRFIAFGSRASNLVPGDTNGRDDVFVVGGVSVTPTTQAFSGAGGAGTVDVTFVYPGTTWTATTDAPWITVTGQSSPNDNGTVSYSAAPNSTGTPRTGTLTVALQTVTVTQDASAPLAVTLTTPNGGEKVFANVPTSVRWTGSSVPTSFDVELSRNSGGTFTAIPVCTALAGTATSCMWTPTGPASTTARIRVTARNDSGTAVDVSDADFTISTATPSVTVTRPNTALSLVIGAADSIRWNHNLGLQSFVRVELSRDGGASWEVLAASFQNTGATSSIFPWVVTGPVSSSALIRVTWLDGPTSDVSNVAFSIVRPTITVTAPNTGVTWTVGTPRTITWTHSMASGQLVNLDASRDSGATWSSIASGVANATTTTGTFNWVVTGPATSTARVRVSWASDTAANDASNVNFSIVTPSIAVTAPNTAVTWRAGNTQTLRFTHNLGPGQPVAFDVSRDGGSTWTPIISLTTTTSNAVTYAWVVSGPPTPLARIRARWTSDPGVFDVSDVNFAIISRITVTAPNTAVTWGAGSTRQITWTHNLGLAETVNIDVSPDGGAIWVNVAAGVANATATSGSFAALMPGSVTTQALVRVSQTTDPTSFDTSDVVFTLAAPVITVTAPNTNVNWTIGSTRSISWSHDLGTGEAVEVALSRDDGATWAVLTSALANTGNTSGTFSWVVTGPATTTARVRVRWMRNGAVQDVSNVAFRIQ